MIKPRFSAKKILRALFFSVILILCVTILVVTKKQTPYDYLKKNSNDNINTPSELLYQETLDTGFTVIFYIDQRGLYNCAVVNETLFSYRTIDVSGSLGIYNDKTYLYSSFADGQNKHNICWGILNDESVTSVFLDNEPCNIAGTTYNFRVFWLMDIDAEPHSLTTNS